MTDAVLQQFAQRLAQLDGQERQALLQRVQLLAVNITDPEKFEAPIRRLGEYLDTDIPVPPILVEPALIVRGGVTARLGRAGKGKTQSSLNGILKWAAGMPVFDGLQTKSGKGVLEPADRTPLKTLIIENEGAPGMFQEQLKIMVAAPGRFSDKQRALVRENVLIWGDGGYSGLKLDDEKMLNTVRAGVEKWEPDIVFIEPFRGLWKGEENSSTDMAGVADALSGIAAEYNCGVLLTHHERKAGVGEDGEKMSAGRGSTVLEGFVATMENFEAVKGGEYRELSWSKRRYGRGEPLLPVRMEWNSDDFWYRLVPMDETEQAVMDTLAEAGDDPVTIADLAEQTGETKAQVVKILKRMTEQDQVLRLPSIYGAGGSSGYRYKLKSTTDSDNDAGDF